MKKRVFTLLMALLMIATVVCGCSANMGDVAGDDMANNADVEPDDNANVNEDANAEDGTEADGLVKIAFSPDGMNDESQAYAARLFQKFGADYGFDVTILDGQSDAQIQSQVLTSAISQGFEIIIVNPTDVFSVAPAIKEVNEAGITVGMFSTDLPAEYQQFRDFWVGADHVQSGKTAAEFIIEKFPDGANVVEVGGQAGHNAAIGRHDGFTEGLEGSNINVLDYQSGNTWSTSDAMNIMEDFIVKYGDEIDAVFCHWDNGCTGCIEALQAANMTGVYMIGVDGCKNGFDQVNAGTQDVSVMQNFVTQVQQTLEICQKVVAGESYEQTTACPWDIVTSDNIDSFEYPEW